MESLCFAADAEVAEQVESSDVSSISHTEVLRAQSEDQAINEIVEVLQGHCTTVSSTEGKLLFSEKSRLVLRDGLLFRKRQLHDDLMHQ